MKILSRLFIILFTLVAVSSFARTKAKKERTQILYAPSVRIGLAPKLELKMFTMERDTSNRDSIKLFICNWDTATKKYIKPDSAKVSISLKYYDTLNDISLFKATIRDAYIKEVDLRKLGKLINRTLYIDFPVQFKNCCIGRFVCCDTMVDSIVFKADVAFSFCTISEMVLPPCVFQRNFSMEKPIINNYLSFEGSKFFKAFSVYISYKDWFDYNKLNYNTIDSAAQKIFANGYNRQRLDFKNCVFKGNASVFNDVAYYKLYFNSGHFDSTAQFTRTTDKKKRIEDSSATKNEVFELYNIDLSNTAFKDTASFYREHIRNVNFKSACFKGVLNLFEVSFADTADKAFSQARFSDTCTCILRPDNFYISNLKFNWVTVDNINFPFVDDTGGIINLDNPAVYDPEEIENIEKYYGSLREQAKGFYSKQDGVYDKLGPKYEHQMIRYQMKNYAHNGRYLSYFAIAIPELFVKNGFEGEGRFFLLTISAILLFAFLFFFFCKREMVAYFNDGDNSLSPEDTAATPLPGDKKNNVNFKTYFKGLWLSTIVLISPHFPRKYFKIKGVMFGFVIMEWLLGLLMIILFFVYIAGHYTIVKTLIGI